AESNRIWYNYPGQTSDAIFTGTFGSPSAIGRVLDDGSTQLTQYTYNSLGKPLSVTVSGISASGTVLLSRTTNYTYAANGIDLVQVQQKNRSGYDTLASFQNYNGLHEPQKVFDASGQETDYAYNSAGQVSSATDALGHTTNYYYDPAGNPNTTDSSLTGYLVAIVRPAVNASAGPVTAFAYDHYGRVQTITYNATDTPNSYLLTFGYDNLNRLTRVTYPDQSFTQYDYTNLDLTQLTDRRGRVTHYRYNPLRQLVEVLDPLGRRTVYDWCGCGALEAIIAPAAGTNDFLTSTTFFVYDVQGRLTTKIFPDKTTLAYTYENTTSRLHSVTDALNQTTTYGYNSDDSLATVSYTNTVNPTPNVSFFYETPYLRLHSMTDSLIVSGSPVTQDTTTYAYYPVPASGATTGARKRQPIATAMPVCQC